MDNTIQKNFSPDVERYLLIKLHESPQCCYLLHKHSLYLHSCHTDIGEGLVLESALWGEFTQNTPFRQVYRNKPWLMHYKLANEYSRILNADIVKFDLYTKISAVTSRIVSNNEEEL